MEDWKKNYTKVEDDGWQRTQDSLIEEKRAKDGLKACTILYIYYIPYYIQEAYNINHNQTCLNAVLNINHNTWSYFDTWQLF